MAGQAAPMGQNKSQGSARAGPPQFGTILILFAPSRASSKRQIERDLGTARAL